MSRTNPYKKKRRQADKILLMFGEGRNEVEFLRHLKKLYSYNINVSIKIRMGKGGSPQDIVIDAGKIPGAYNRRVVVFDNDKSKREMIDARQEAKNRDIEIIENTPCLEFLLLSILDKKIAKNEKSDWYKNKFKYMYINKKKRREVEEYEKLFPKKLLDSKRYTISELNKLISIMEGK